MIIAYEKDRLIMLLKYILLSTLLVCCSCSVDTNDRIQNTPPASLFQIQNAQYTLAQDTSPLLTLTVRQRDIPNYLESTVLLEFFYGKPSEEYPFGNEVHNFDDNSTSLAYTFQWEQQREKELTIQGWHWFGVDYVRLSILSVTDEKQEIFCVSESMDCQIKILILGKEN